MNGLQGARILIVGNLPPPHGGIAVHCAALRERLLAAGARVTLLDVGGRAAPEADVVPVRSAGALAAQLVRHAPFADVVHVHISGHTRRSWLVALAGTLAARARGAAGLVTVHSGLLPTFLDADPLAATLVRRTCELASRVLAVNGALAKRLREVGVDGDRVAIAPAFTGLVAPGAAPAAFTAARARRRPLLACAVSPSPIYGTRLLLAALPALTRRHPNVGVAVFGPGEPRALLALADRYGVADRVVGLGEIDHAQALAVIAGCELFVRPTLADGDALSVREARALGVPVAASAVGERGGDCELFEPGDAFGLARAVERGLAQRPPPSRPEVGAATVLAVYGELLAGAPALRAAAGAR